MDTKRLSNAMEAVLNDQMTKEAWAAQIYLSYAAWADGEGYEGVANFLFRHTEEERNHMMKFLEYILERGGKVKVTAVPGPNPDPKDIQDCFEGIFKQEVDNTESIYKIVKQSFDEGDWATWNFMQWFVKEQAEEEKLAMDLLDRIKIVGGKDAKPDALYALDRELKDRPDEATLAQDVTATNP